MKERKLFDIVKELLETKQVLRDSDKKLVWAVWMRLGFATRTAVQLEQYMNPNCPSSDTITRARRKVVEAYPNLAGSKSVEDIRKTLEDGQGSHIAARTVLDTGSTLMESKKGHWDTDSGKAIWVAE